MIYSVVTRRTSLGAQTVRLPVRRGAPLRGFPAAFSRGGRPVGALPQEPPAQEQPLEAAQGRELAPEHAGGAGVSRRCEA